MSWEEIRVLIARDRRCAGGGIHWYFEAIRPHLSCRFRFCDIGRPHEYYGGRGQNGWLSSASRVVCDWIRFGWQILWFRPSLVHLNGGLDREERSLRREAVSLRIAGMLGCPVLVFWHGWDHPARFGNEFPGGRGGWLWKCYARASAHVVLSTRFADDLKRWGFVAPVHLATTVVSPEVLEPDAGQASASGKCLLFLSRVERAKGVWELLDAYALLKSRDAEYRLVIAGDGPDLAALKLRAAELALTEVTFAGFVVGEEKLRLLRDASIFCFPSYSEGMPLAVLEALAMGLPVVASDVGGLRDILRDGEHGVIVTFHPEAATGSRFDPNELAGAIQRLSDDPKSSREIGRHNAAYARVRFSPAMVAWQLERIYRKTSGGMRPRRDAILLEKPSK